MPQLLSKLSLRTALAVLLLAALLAGCSLAGDVTPPPGSEVQALPVQPTAVMNTVFYPVVAPDPAAGALIYAEKCAPCHGDQGLGDGPRAAQLSVPVKAIGSLELGRPALPAEWFRIVTQGNLDRFMPGFTSLSDRQRWDVVAYALTLSQPAGALEQGAELYAANCLECHGEMGRGDGPQAQGDPGDFTDQEWMASLSAEAFYQAIDQGAGAEMPAFGDRLSSDEVWTLAAYVRLLSFAGANPGATETAQVTPFPGAALSETVTSTATSSVTVEMTLPEGVELSSEPLITLYVVDSMALTYSTTVSTRSGNSYLFEDVEMIEGRAFVATADYANVTYNSTIQMVQDLTQPVLLQLEVYDVTTDTAGLQIDRLHMFMDFISEDVVQVVELLILSNSGDSTIVGAGAGEPVVYFSLPDGATDLQFQDGVLGDRYLQTPTGFADSMPVAPGSGNYQVVVAFNLPYERKLSFSQKMDYPVASSIVLIPEMGVRSKSSVLKDEGVSDMEGTEYRSFSSQSLDRGALLEIELSGAPKLAGAQVTTDDRTGLLIGLAGLGLALTLAGLWLYRREKLSAGAEAEDLEGEDGEVDEAGAAEETVDELMDAIIALDDLYKAGELPQEAYEQRRAELKARLEQMME